MKAGIYYRVEQKVLSPLDCQEGRGKQLTWRPVFIKQDKGEARRLFDRWRKEPGICLRLVREEYVLDTLPTYGWVTQPDKWMRLVDRLVLEGETRG